MATSLWREQAVDQKIEDQRGFVGWWTASVTPGQSPGRGGRESFADRGTIPMRKAEALSGISNQDVARWRQRLRNVPAYKRSLAARAWRAAMNAGNARGHSFDDEWNTPAEVFTLERQVLGSIDLDPASNRAAQQIVRARRFVTKADNGLDRPWRGRVWLNPPYSPALIGQFVTKLLHERRAGRAHIVSRTVRTPARACARLGVLVVGRRSTMPRGTVKWFNPTKGYGFIQPQGGGKDVFVHISAVERAGLSTLNEGQSIEYEIEENRGKPSAVNLKVR
jgi:CspA family cold shock protein